MNIVEMYGLCKEIYNDNCEKYDYIGLRFEDKERTIGEICNNSRHNPDREDERDFPEFGEGDYLELEELDGTSAWDLSENNVYRIGKSENREDDCSKHFYPWHCYIVAGDELGRNSDVHLDLYEIVIKGAVVIAQIF